MKSNSIGAAMTGFALLAMSLAATAADQPGAAALAPDTASDIQRRTQDAFAGLGYAPLPTKAPLLRDVPPPRPTDNVMVFGGQFTTDTMVHSLDPFTAHHEKQYMVAVAYGHDVVDAPWGFVLGPEIGTGFRFGMGSSQEFWAGINLRHQGFVLFNFVRIAPGITVGFSGITKATGREANRESRDPDTTAQFLGYLGPELTLSLVENPNWELVYRLQHRSGLYGLIANTLEGANANTVGIRYRF